MTFLLSLHEFRTVKLNSTPLQVLATGFALTQYDIEIRGRHGKTREQYWKEAEGKATFKTVAMSGFPNFFYILGPNSGRVYTSTLVMIERWVVPLPVRGSISCC